MSLVRNTTRSLKAGFAPTTLKKAGTILAGNVGASFFADKLAQHVPMVRSNAFFEIGTLLLLASAQGMVVKKFIPKILNANDIFIGGLIAGATRALKLVLPSTFMGCGLGEDFEGMGSYYADPRQIMHAFPLHGIGAYPGPQAPMIGTHGLGDEAVYPQVQHAITLDGMANDAVGQEIANQM